MYAHNNPLMYTDPFGLWAETDCSSGKGKCWVSDRKDDTYASLAKILGVNASGLGDFFSNQSISMGQAFDTSGYGRWAIDQFIDRSAHEDPPFIPAAGGLNVIGRGGGGLLSRIGSAIGRMFGRGAATEAIITRTIQVVQREGNLVEMVGKGARGEIRVLTEMTKQGDTLVLKGLHMEGAGAGSTGIRELREFARQLGKEQGVNKVVIEGAERTTGANPGHIPRTIEIKVN